MSDDVKPYIGRFAPSPTGPLHFGSLVAAVASYLDALSHQGSWLVRMEDLDKQREMPGAADEILHMLEAYGFEWQEAVIYQSQRFETYQSVLEQLIADDLVYPCNCSRKEIAAIAHAGIESPVYPGLCRNGLSRQRKSHTWRLKTECAHLVFKDEIQGMFDHHMQRDVGDFILKRADGQFAYQLAVVVDDAQQGINHVVRGADLLNSTSRQILLQYYLGLRSPRYAHIPLAVSRGGQKLSKQNHATPLDKTDPAPSLIEAFRFLGIDTQHYVRSDSLTNLWSQALHDWNITQVSPRKALPISRTDIKNS